MPLRYRRLGESELVVSVVGLGCVEFGGRVDLDGARRIVDAALDMGITLLDTADVYGRTRSEAFLGEVLEGRRERVVLATKFGHRGYDLGLDADCGSKGGRVYIRRAVEASLRRLRTDYIDLYQLHGPIPETPIAETLSALDELVREGKVRFPGLSNFGGRRLTEAARAATASGAAPFVSVQNHWSLLERDAEADVVPTAIRCGLGVLPFLPLAHGLLTGKVRRGLAVPSNSRLARLGSYVTAEKLERVEALIAWGEENGRTLLEIAIGALAAQPGCASVIAGATTPDQVDANAAAGAWVPTAQERAAIDAIVPPPGR